MLNNLVISILSHQLVVSITTIISTSGRRKPVATAGHERDSSDRPQRCVSTLCHSRAAATAQLSEELQNTHPVHTSVICSLFCPQGSVQG